MDWINLLKNYLKYFTQNGLGISLFLGYFISKKYHINSEGKIDKCLNILLILSYAVALLISFSYLKYPNYYDHVEPTVAMLGLMVKHGEQLYPPIDAYTLHGLLYGPFLTEIQATFQLLPFDSIVNSKIPGVLAFFLFSLLSFFTLRGVISRSYLIILLMFGPYVFWVRAEPIFLIISIISWVVCSWGSSWRWVLFGILGGLAAALKIHGFLYVFPFMCISWIKQPLKLEACIRSLIFSAALAVLVFLLCFYPSFISIKNYLMYMNLATHHGVSYDLAERNMVYSILLQIPVLILFPWRSENNRLKICYGLIILSIILVSIAGGKAGSGLHHLMPFVVVNACLLEILSDLKAETIGVNFKYSYLLLALYFLISDAPRMAINIANDNNINAQILAKEELASFQLKYPDMFMGITDSSSNAYPFTYYRVILRAAGNQQMDPAAYMDLQYSGVSDDSLQTVLINCERPIIVLPSKGRPFSILNFYTSTPLFSNQIREVFLRNYFQVERGIYYDVYQCLENKR